MGNILNSEVVASVLLNEGEKFYKAEHTEAYDLADDNGYAYHKLAAWVIDSNGEKRIKTACIASRAQLGRANISATGGNPVGLFEIDHTHYTVGENVPEPESIRSASYCHSEVNNVLVANAITQAGLIGHKVRLATGLPLKQYFSVDGDLNTPIIDKVQRSLKPLAEPVGQESKLDVAEHIVYAESLSAFVDWLIDDDGNLANEVHNGVLVVDVGGGTTDISFITSSHELYMPGSDTIRTGVLNVFSRLRQLLSAEFDVDMEHIRDDMLDRALRTGQFSVRGASKSCSELVEQAKRYVAKRLNNRINELVTGTLDHIIFVGGGAEALREQLLNLDEYEKGFVVIPDEPQFANVRGMLKCMTYEDAE